MNAGRLSILLIVVLLSAAPVAAQTPLQLKWADLVPQSAQMENPFVKLPRDQLQWISDVAAVRDRQARADPTLTAADLAKEADLSRRLQQAGVDVDALLAMRREIASRGSALNAELEGRLIRMPGYLLPLEFSGKAVSEFLLVPWVGACIHTPPPPPNQIVYVRPKKPVELPGMFAPVWVTGRLDTGRSTQTLDMIDGQSEIDVGYSLRGADVAPYTR
jgi:uncharacterized protein